MSTDITLSTVVAARPNHVSTNIKDETVLLQVESRKYYSLNEVGSVIWERLKTPTAVSVLVDAVLEEFEVEREPCASDTLQLIATLVDAGFVEACP